MLKTMDRIGIASALLAALLPVAAIAQNVKSVIDVASRTIGADVVMAVGYSGMADR